MTRTEVSPEFVREFMAKPGIKVESAEGPYISQAVQKRLQDLMVQRYPQLRKP